MTSQPSYPPTRPNLTSIVAACILSGGLITAAIIDSHKPAAPVATSPVTESGRRLPPLSKESVGVQLKTQLLASPQLKGVKPVDAGSGFPASEITRGSRCDLTEVTATEIRYDAKEDNFTVVFDLTWQCDSGATVKDEDNVGLTNDGYGDYTGVFSLPGAASAVSGNAPEVKVNVQ